MFMCREEKGFTCEVEKGTGTLSVIGADVKYVEG
jgi:hypothetical protein